MKTIRELREEQGWSQFEMAIKAGVTPSTISNWERGVTEPKVSQLRKLAELFGVSMDVIQVSDREASALGNGSLM